MTLVKKNMKEWIKKVWKKEVLIKTLKSSNKWKRMKVERYPPPKKKCDETNEKRKKVGKNQLNTKKN